MCNGTRVHRGGKRGEVVVQRYLIFELMWIVNVNSI